MMSMCRIGHKPGVRQLRLIGNALLLGIWAVPSAWAGVPEEARAGARLFADSAYKDAALAFRQATIAAPDDVRWRYDLGLAEALGQDFENALNNLGATARQAPPEVAGASYYNSGNVHLAMGNFAEAAGAFRQALIRNPDDLDAKHNLELALKRLQQQSEQSGSQGDSTQNQEQKDQDSKDQQQKSKDPNEQEKQDQQQDKDQQNPEDAEQNQAQDSTGQEPPPDPGEQPSTDSTLSRDQAERILRALAAEEARLRDQAKRTLAIPAPGGKDW